MHALMPESFPSQNDRRFVPFAPEAVTDVDRIEDLLADGRTALRMATEALRDLPYEYSAGVKRAIKIVEVEFEERRLLRDSLRDALRDVLRHLTPQDAPKDLADPHDTITRRLRDTNADKAYFANYSLRVLRVLMEHCVDIGWRDSNPARGVPELKGQKRPEREPWPRELLDAYREACPLGTRERLVMELCIGTGQRIGDVLNMRWSNIEDGGVSIRQSKTSKELWVPILLELQAALDTASRHSVFILTNERATNKWSYRGASAVVRKVRERIGALDYDIHSWRYNAACGLVEAGCGDDLVAAVTGQSPAMVLHYTKKVRQKVRAKQAQQRRLESKEVL